MSRVGAPTEGLEAGPILLVSWFVQNPFPLPPGNRGKRKGRHCQ